MKSKKSVKPITCQIPWPIMKIDWTIPRKKKSCKIYLVRHAQTVYNKNHIFTGWKDSKLTKLGIQQAKKVAKKMKDLHIDVAFHTHLSRSTDTLKEIMKFHPECFLTIEDDRMLERCYGDLQGHTHSSFIKTIGEKRYKELCKDYNVKEVKGQNKNWFIENLGKVDLQLIRRSYNIPPPNGESIQMVEKRVLAYVKDLLKFIKRNKVHVIISAHGNSMRPFRRHFEKLSIHKMMELENPWDDFFTYNVKV